MGSIPAAVSAFAIRSAAPLAPAKLWFVNRSGPVAPSGPHTMETRNPKLPYHLDDRARSRDHATESKGVRHMGAFSVIVATAAPPGMGAESAGAYVKIDGREALLRSVELFLNRDNIKQIQLVVQPEAL